MMQKSNQKTRLPAPSEPTPAQRAAAWFVATQAAEIDRRRGIITLHGTPETQARVIDLVRAEFFNGENNEQ